MPHSWKAYEKAMEIFQALRVAGHVAEKDELTIRGIIQIMLEEGSRF